MRSILLIKKIIGNKTYKIKFAIIAKTSSIDLKFFCDISLCHVNSLGPAFQKFYLDK